MSDVRASSRLVDSPACLVAPEGGPDRGLGKLLERQAGKGGIQPVLEINPGHAFVAKLSKSKSDKTFEDLAWLLLDQARILEGAAPADPAKFAERMNRFVLGSEK